MKQDIVAAFHVQEANPPLDPSQLWVTDRYVLMDNINIKLVHINAHHDYEMLLAEGIEASSDGLKYKISIKDAHFSDGSRITAEDISRSFKRIILKGSAHIPFKEIIRGASSLKHIDEDFAGIKVLGQKTIEISLDKKVKEFLYYLTLADACIIHKNNAYKEIIKQDDWNIVSGGYFLSQNKLIKNERFLFHSINSPKTVQLLSPPEKGTTKDILSYDVGYSQFIDRADFKNQTLPTPFRYASHSYQYLVYLVLNNRRGIFRSEEKRRQVHYLISKNLHLNPNNLFFKRAHQFFLPDSFAFQKDFSSIDVLEKSSRAGIVEPFKILTTTGTRKYTPNDLEARLRDSLKSDVTISFEDDITRFKDRKSMRDFDAYLVPTSMSYNVITESLNLLYRSNVRFADNPNGKILDLMQQYQTSQGSDPQLIESIVREMTLESEIIPLFYMSAPKFYNSDVLDISEMNTSESLTFWKMRVK